MKCWRKLTILESGRQDVVNIETYPTHIAGMPVAINICCHVNRHIRRTI